MHKLLSSINPPFSMIYLDQLKYIGLKHTWNYSIQSVRRHHIKFGEKWLITKSYIYVFISVDFFTKSGEAWLNIHLTKPWIVGMGTLITRPTFKVKDNVSLEFLNGISLVRYIGQRMIQFPENLHSLLLLIRQYETTYIQNNPS